LSFHAPAIDVTSPMYLPDKRAKREYAPLALPAVKSKRNGSHEEKQAWMRRRQAYRDLLLREANDTPTRREKRIAAENERMAAVEGQRETELLAGAQSEIQRRRIARCETEIALMRMLPESAAQKAYLPAMGEADWHAEKRLLEKATQ
jgi:hypothetical protein